MRTAGLCAMVLGQLLARGAHGAAPARCAGALARTPSLGGSQPLRLGALARQRMRALATDGSAGGDRPPRGLGGLSGARIVVHSEGWTPPTVPAEKSVPRVQTFEYSFFDDEGDIGVGGRGSPNGGRRAAPRQPRGTKTSAEAPVGATLDVQVGRCAGCGVTLQASEAGAPGFLPQAHLERSAHVGHRVICARCHGLLHQNSADKEVRVGHSSRDELSPQRFEQLLEACLLGHDARSPSGVGAPSSAGCGVIVYLVDLFDLEGSFLEALPPLVGDTPLILVGTKVDTLPVGVPLPAVEKWLRTACRERLGGIEPAEVHLISATTGRGVARLGSAVMRLAERNRDYGDVYVVGAANVGKSSLINSLIAPKAAKKRKQLVGPKGGLGRAGDVGAAAGAGAAASTAKAAKAAAVERDDEEEDGFAIGSAEGALDVSLYGDPEEEEEEEDADKEQRLQGDEDEDEEDEAASSEPLGELSPAEALALKKAATPRLLTASHLPGTTLEPVRIRCRDGLVLFDTPGLVLRGQLATLLTPQEVALLLPRGPVKPKQLSLAKGKSLLLGGLARVDVVETGFAAHVVLAAHVAPSLTLHPTSFERAEAVRKQHCGDMLTPPLGGPGRLAALGPLQTTEIEIDAGGFRRASADVAIGGLGWLAVVGDGLVRLRVHAPKDVRVVPREPLNPLVDGTKGNAKFTGTRVVGPKGPKRKAGGGGRGR